VDYNSYKKISKNYKEDFEKYNRRKITIMSWYYKIFHRLEVIGLENIPLGPAVLAANHSGGYDLDLFAISHYLHPRREVTPLIVNTWHFSENWWGKYFIGAGVPLWTQGGLRYDYIDPYLKDEGDNFPGLMCIFPEGYIQSFKKRNTLAMFYPGVVRIALKYKVPIVPVAMIGFQWACPVLGHTKVEKGPDDIFFLPLTFPAKLKMVIGKPLLLEKYYDQNLSKEEEFWIANNLVRNSLGETMKNHVSVSYDEVIEYEMKEPEANYFQKSL